MQPRNPISPVACRRPLSRVLRCGIGLLLLSLAGAGLAQGRRPGGGGGRPRPPAEPPPVVFATDGDRWAWLQFSSDPGEPVALMVGGPGQAARRLAQGQGWTDVAVRGDRLWVLAQTGDRGAVLSVDGASGATSTVRSGLRSPAALKALPNALVWLEWTPPRRPALPFVHPQAGRVTASVLPDGAAAPSVVEVSGVARPGQGDLLGELHNRVVLRVRRRTGTEMLCIDPTRRIYDLLCAETGAQTGLVHGNRLYWTAPSVEATPDSGLRCVKRTTPSGPEVVSDWLLSFGELIAVRTGVCYATNRVLWLPERTGRVRRGGETGMARLASDGERLLRVTPEGGLELFTPPTGGAR